eukprot:SM002472S08305  [mRNA]  locus=s2472:71:1123:+ [translate_table: standard]
MVAQQVKRELGQMLLQDKVLREAVLPESALGADLYLSSVATITDVEMSGDLQVAKVFVSVYADERGQDIAMEGLRAKAGYVRTGLGRRMRLRMTPEVRFIKDDSLERGARVLSILSRLKDEREKKERGGLERDSTLGDMEKDDSVPEDGNHVDYDADEDGYLDEDEDEDNSPAARINRRTLRKANSGESSRVHDTKKGVQFVWRNGKDKEAKPTVDGVDDDYFDADDDRNIIYIK